LVLLAFAVSLSKLAVITMENSAGQTVAGCKPPPLDALGANDQSPWRKQAILSASKRLPFCYTTKTIFIGPAGAVIH
jgi:hypothetical protein